MVDCCDAQIRESKLSYRLQPVEMFLSNSIYEGACVAANWEDAEFISESNRCHTYL